MKTLFIFLSLLMIPSFVMAYTTAITQTGNVITISDSSGKQISISNIGVYYSMVNFTDGMTPFNKTSISPTTATAYKYFKIIKEDGTTILYIPNWNTTIQVDPVLP